MKILRAILHTCTLLYAVDYRFCGEATASKISTEDSEVRSPFTINKFSLIKSKKIKSKDFFTLDPNFLNWLHENYSETEENLDIIVEGKKREDAYQRTAAENSPYSLLILVIYDKKKGSSKVCTGTLLTTRWVLTAAHCLTFNNLTAVEAILYAGGNSLEELNKFRPDKKAQIKISREFHIHPDYRPNSCYDIAVIKSKKEFSLRQTIQVINISNQPWAFQGFKECTFTGFGVVTEDKKRDDDNTRKTHQLKIESPCHCASIMNELFNEVNSSTYLCSKAQEDFGVCMGDSGGGLVCDGEVMGVSIIMVELGNTETCELNYSLPDVACGGKNTISVFQNIYFVRKWIHSYLEEPRSCKYQNYNVCKVLLATGLLTLSMVINVLNPS